MGPKMFLQGEGEMSKTCDVVDEAMMLTRRDVAALLKCSDRHVARMEKDRLIPTPVRLRSSIRWPRLQIERWIEAGCPALAV